MFCKSLVHTVLFYILLLYGLGGLKTLCAQQQSAVHKRSFSGVGIPNAAINTVCEDYRGFIWFATNYGLYRFDGSECTPIKAEINGLYHNYLRTVVVSPDSTLWIVYGDVVNQLTNIEVFDPLTYKLTSLEESLNAQIPFDVKDKNIIVKKNNDGSLWIYNEQELFEYNGKRLYKRLQLDEGVFIKDVEKGNDNTIWLSVQKKRYGPFQLLYFDSNGTLLESSEDLISIELLCVNKEGALIYSRKKNESELPTNYKKKPLSPLVKFEYTTQKRYKIQFYVPSVRQFWCVESAYNTEVSIFDINGELLDQTRIDFPAYYINQLRFRRNIFFDASGRLWLFDKDYIRIIELATNNFQRYIYTPNLKYKNPVRGITRDAYGTLYINGNTIVKQKSATTVFEEFKDPPNEKIAKTILYAEDSGAVWFSLQKNHRWMKYDPQTEVRTIYPLDSSVIGLEEKNVPMRWTFHRDQKGRLWQGHANGLSFLDETCNCVKPYLSTYNLNVVFHIYENSKGIWLLTSTGVYLMDYAYNIIEHYHSNGKGNNFLKHNIIAHLFEDKNGSFWLGSKGGGLIQWDPETGVQHSYNIKNGLSDNVVYAVYPDSFGNLWLSTNQGINCFDTTNHDVIIFTEANGISHHEFNTISHHQDKDGRLFFGSLNGVTAFYPRDLVTQKTKASLQIVSVHKYSNKKQGDSTITTSVLKDKRIDILPTDRETILRFALLDYVNPKLSKYAYKIAGLDEDWNYLKNPEVHLAGLPYGTYSLLLKAKGIGKKWQENSLSLTIVVHKPFYFETWFVLLFLHLILALFGIVIKLRLQFLEKQRSKLRALVKRKTATIEEQTEALKSLDKMKSQFFVNISHELRTPLTLIMGPLMYLIEAPKSEEKELMPQLKLMERNSRRLMNLVEEILDLSKLEAQKVILNEQNIDLEDFGRWIFSMFKGQAEQRGIQFSWAYRLEENLLVKLDKNKVEKVLVNLLSNAFKFTAKEGVVSFEIKELNQNLVFVVQDNGTGILPEDLAHVFDRFYQSKTTAEGGTGVGLALSKELTNLMKGELSVKSTTETGTAFTFLIPKVIGNSKNLVLLDQQISNQLINSLPVSNDTNEGSKKQRVLIVEDNTDMRYFIRSLLVSFCEVQEAEDGKAAQKLLQETEDLPNLIISDVMMPKMDGMALLEYLKSEAKFSKIPVIMLTAKSDQEYKIQALTIGVDDYLIKPFSPNELLARVRNLTRYAAGRKELLEVEELEPVEDCVVKDAGIKAVSNENDQIWIKEIEIIAKDLIENTELDAKIFAKATSVSLRTLQRKIKHITGLSITAYLREIRLQKARDLLERGAYATIAETAYAAGFGTPYYFSKLYEDRFGKKVNEYFQNK